VQERVVNPTHGYLSQSELPATFGLGLTAKVEKLEITWPSGQKQEIESPVIDQLLTLEEPAAAEAPTP
jgi:hypothetical protein